MKLHDHAFSFGLEVISSREDAKDVTGADLRRALLARLATMTDQEVREACDGGCPFDTNEVDPADTRSLTALPYWEIITGVWGAKVVSVSVQGQLLEGPVQSGHGLADDGLESTPEDS